MAVRGYGKIQITGNTYIKRNKMENENCCKEKWHNCCCCNCENHLEDFNHCTTIKEPHDKCVCNEHKGWICRMQFDDTGYIRYHSDWSEHGMCEMHHPITK